MRRSRGQQNVSNTKSPASGARGSVDGVNPPTAAVPLRTVAAVGVVIIVIDQITKVWAVSALQNPDRDIDLFWTLRLNFTENFGSAFGLGAGLGRWLGLVILVVIVAVLWYARSISDRRVLVLLGAIAGGAIGNIIDRVVRAEDGFLSGGVVDFIDFQWWPIFNIADMAVVGGAIGLMLLSFREPEVLESDSSDRTTSHGLEGEQASKESNGEKASKGKASKESNGEIRSDSADTDALDVDDEDEAVEPDDATSA